MSLEKSIPRVPSLLIRTFLRVGSIFSNISTGDAYSITVIGWFCLGGLFGFSNTDASNTKTGPVGVGAGVAEDELEDFAGSFTFSATVWFS